MSNRNVGNRRVSGQQLDILWEYLNSHRDIALAFNRSLEAKEHSKRKWQEIANILNAQGDGAHKDWKSWSKYWIDYKAKLKRRVAALRLCQNRTGGGPSTEQPLSDIENKFLQILGEDYGQGLSGVRVESFPPAESAQRAESTQPAMDIASMEVINFPFPDTIIPDQASESILASTSFQTFVVQAPSTPPRTQTPHTAPPLNRQQCFRPGADVADERFH
ncbi:uncharacterized protein LOC121725991 [Aricia agestis]|uniref:uncharacterized protein LOC121725991 n=1 Tax=Aricia agestis TaxID=91739 RepID=UPI001C20A277|nr:uncharacterized protein LOC121725991 [Aricia agestis]